MPLYKNVSAFLFASTAVDKISSVDVRESGDEINHSSDTDEYLTHVDAVRKRVEVTVSTDNLEDALDTFTIGQKGTVTFTIDNIDGSTDLDVTLVNAVLMDMSGSPKHAAVDSAGQLRYVAFSADGTTSPLSIA